MISISRFASLGVFIFASWQMLDTFSARPAFNRSLQVEAVTGGQRPPMQQSLYSQAEYLFQIAYGYQNALAVSVLSGGFENLPSAEEIAANTSTARKLALESLKKSPGKSEAWLVVAGSCDPFFELDLMIKSIVNSFSVAPTDQSAAFSRLLISLPTLGEDLPEQALRHPELMLAIRSDLALLSQTDPRRLAEIKDLDIVKTGVLGSIGL